MALKGKSSENNTVYVVGCYIDDTTWEFLGIHDSEEDAIFACLNEKCFIGPYIVNQRISTLAEEWPGAWYPMLEERPEYSPCS